MSNHKHTPGPWSWNHGRLLHNVEGSHSDTVLDIEEKVWPPTDEDARLIAAAPELLAALIDCRNELAVMLRRHNERNEEDGSWRYDGQTIGEADEVIIKATGGDV